MQADIFQPQGDAAPQGSGRLHPVENNAFIHRSSFWFIKSQISRFALVSHPIWCIKHKMTHENMSRDYGRACAETKGGNTMADPAEVVSGWAKGGALEKEVIALTDTSYIFNVTRCRFARRQTIIESVSCCDFKFFLDT